MKTLNINIITPMIKTIMDISSLFQLRAPKEKEGPLKTNKLNNIEYN